MNCPRCEAPVKGDYKYCPECACRLRIKPAPAEPETRSMPLGGVLLGLVAAGLVAAGIFVGYEVLGERKTEFVTPPPTRQILTMDDVPNQMVTVPEGVAFWAPTIVYEAPPADEVDARVLRTFHRHEVARFLDTVMEEPERLTRWTRLLRLLHERTRDVMVEKVRHVPIRTRAYRMMRYEVTRGHWAEFLRAVERNPALLRRYASGLWRPGERHPWAVDYRADWWWDVQEQLRRRFAEEPRDADGAAAQNEDEDPEVPIPDFIAAAFDEGASLDTITDADAIKLLYPTSWVRMDEGGALYWVLEAGTEDLPVTGISWYDVELFVVWARQRLGLNKLRVPNWAEWSRAFHGNHPEKPVDDYDEEGDAGWRWPWGSEVRPHGCNNLNHSWNIPTARIRDVRRHYDWHEGKTVDGVLNMAGNAAEWTRSASDEYELGEDGASLYVKTSDPDEGKTDRAFVCGGSYLSGLDDCSVKGAFTLRKTERRIDVGFRLVVDPGLLSRPR